MLSRSLGAQELGVSVAQWKPSGATEWSFPTTSNKKNRENPQVMSGIFPGNFPMALPKRRSPNWGQLPLTNTAYASVSVSRFVTCSEIWALFLADDLLYSQRPQSNRSRSITTGNGSSKNSDLVDGLLWFIIVLATLEITRNQNVKHLYQKLEMV